jgi:hypothetical protein
VTGTDATTLTAPIAQASNRQKIGRVMNIAADTKYGLIDLNI